MVRFPFGAGLLAALLVGIGCDGTQATASRMAAIEQLERLVFVPAGRSDLPGHNAEFSAEALEALLVDRFEVRRKDFDQDAAPGEFELPAFVTWVQANAFAATRGMRLPTVSEWIYIASGRLGHGYPWGQRQLRSVANTLELGLLRAAPVGTFESGRGPFGTYDQIGNVWEWAADHEVGIGPGFTDGGGDGGLYSALGGSFLSHLRPLFPPTGAPPVFAISLDSRHSAPDVGLRCVVEAREWLLLAIVDLDPASDVESERLQSVGQAWYRTGEGQFTDLLVELEKLLNGGRGTRALRELTAGANL